MKKIVGSVLMMAVMVAFCWYATWRVDQVCTKAAELIRQAEDSFQQEDYRGAKDAIEQSHGVWHRHENLLGLALRHTESEDVDIMYPTLMEACRQEDESEFFLRCQELEAVLRQLAHMEKPYLFNIL